MNQSWNLMRGFIIDLSKKIKKTEEYSRRDSACPRADEGFSGEIADVFSQCTHGLMASEVAAFKGLLNNLLGLYGFLLFLLFRGTTHFNLFANAKELPGVALDKNTV